MIRAVLRYPDGHSVFLMGLSEENIKRLREDQPISVPLQQIDPMGPPDETMPDMNIVVVFDNGKLTSLLDAMGKDAGADTEIWEDV